MTQTLSALLKQKFFDNNGIPLNGGKLFTYSAGTSTKLATYTDAGGLSTNSNPVILDYRGEGNVWVPSNIAYKFILAPSTDTDPPTHPIWTVDNVVNASLLTLYGGVDTGIANAYILNFAAPYSTLTDGVVIYWVPANTNTGPSTINVNGLGPVPIVNQDGSPLYLGQLQAGQFSTIAYLGGSFTLIAFGTLPTINTQNANYAFTIGDANKIVLHTDGTIRTYTVPLDSTTNFPIGTSIQIINQSSVLLGIDKAVGVTLYPFGLSALTSSLFSMGAATSTYITKTAANTWQQSTLTALAYDSGNFAGVLSGMTGSVTPSINWQLIGNNVTLRFFAASSVTGQGTSNATSMTMTGIPAVIRPKFAAIQMTAALADNGAQKGGWASVSTAGVVTFGIGIDGNAAGFTAAGAKGLVAGWNITYPIG